jgi:hypothetical protein
MQMAKKKVIVGGFVIFSLVICSLSLTVVAGSQGCNEAILLGSGTIRPETVVNSLIRQSNGLPKSSTEVVSGWRLPASVAVYPVRNWAIEEVRFGNTASLWDSIMDDDPTYFLEADIRVQYADSSEAHLRWRTWRYGLVICPAVLGNGDGPPGTLELIRP